MTTHDNPRQKLKIIQFNVKAGDHAVLEFSDEEIGIIDFHYVVAQNSPPVIRYLKKRMEVSDDPIVIKFLCISHYDTDHVKGLYEFIEFVKEENESEDRIVIREAWLPADALGAQHKKFCLDLMAEFNNYSNVTATIRNIVNEYKHNLEKSLEYLETLEYIRFRRYTQLPELVDNIKVRGIAPSDKFVDNFRNSTGKSIKKFQNELQSFYNDKINTDDLKNKLKKFLNGGDENWLSSIICLNNDYFSIYFGGDAHLKVWLDSLNVSKNKDADFIPPDFVKVSHHGSKNSSSVEMWEKVLAQKQENSEVIFGISAGKKHKHPSSETLNDIRSVCEKKFIHYEICSTNVCPYCMIEICKHKYHIEENWYEQIKHRSLTEQFISSQRTGDTEKLNLIAYVYEFDVNDGSSEIYKLVLPNFNKEKICVFDKHQHKLYASACPV